MPQNSIPAGLRINFHEDAIIIRRYWLDWVSWLSLCVYISFVFAIFIAFRNMHIGIYGFTFLRYFPLLLAVSFLGAATYWLLGLLFNYTDYWISESIIKSKTIPFPQGGDCNILA